MGMSIVSKEEMLKVHFKKLRPDAVMPQCAKEGDAGYDIVAVDNGTITSDGYVEYKTGLAISPPLGFHVCVFPRSSISKYDLVLANSVGLIDNGYRGEILLRFKPTLRFALLSTETIVSVSPKRYVQGDKIGQLVFVPTVNVNFHEVDILDETKRGTGGFGSSGS